ncbi:Pilus assembly protein, PilO [Orenia metallireducens]|uniref:Pilus assembly protein, PilO n=1 Tax=Orenia metallireducens TaxID=1413210 RepID=A0A285I804_9FIRM|nr:type 4a pilus biogenesis protein PilO [Orenia metallireducens]SNY43186.1 Pilus assembly protein, PilO [Orenia metallireducens]
MSDNIRRKRLESLAPLILAIVLSSLIYCFNIQLSRVKARELKLAVKNKEDNIERLRQLALNPKKQRVMRDEVFKEKLRLDATVPSELGLTKFLKDLEVLIADNQINLTNLSPQDFIMEDNYIKAPINLLFSADYQRLIAFFSQLEAMDRLLTVENLSIIKDKSNSLKIKTLLYIYSLKE